MRSPLFLVVIFLLLNSFGEAAFCQSASPKNYLLGFHAQYQYNLFNNNSGFDYEHFSPVHSRTAGVGLTLLKPLSTKYQFALRGSYNREKVSILSEFSEPNVPYSEQHNYYEKYHAYRLLLSMRRIFPRNKITYTAGLGLFYQYNSNFLIGFSSKASGGNLNPGDTLFYNNNFNPHLGQKSSNVGLEAELGFQIGKHRKWEFNLFFSLPFLNTPRQPSQIKNEWTYKGSIYSTELSYTGKLYLLGLRGTYYFLER